jgi:hypothetical protein
MLTKSSDSSPWRIFLKRSWEKSKTRGIDGKKEANDVQTG